MCALDRFVFHSVRRWPPTRDRWRVFTADLACSSHINSNNDNNDCSKHSGNDGVVRSLIWDAEHCESYIAQVVSSLKSQIIWRFNHREPQTNGRRLERKKPGDEMVAREKSFFFTGRNYLLHQYGLHAGRVWKCIFIYTTINKCNYNINRKNVIYTTPIKTLIR